MHNYPYKRSSFWKEYFSLLAKASIVSLAAYGAYDLGKKLINKNENPPLFSEAYSVASLNAFVNVPNQSRNISLEESLSNVSDNIVEVLIKKQGNLIKRGSGLLLTTDGFVSTAYHVLEPLDENIGDIYVRERSGLEYPVERAMSLQLEDTSVLKGTRPHTETLPMRIRMNAHSPIRKGDQVRVLGYRDGQQYNSLGVVTYPESTWDRKGIGKIENLFETDVRGIQGQSGGVVVNSQGELIGIVVYTRKSDGEGLGVVGAVKISSAKRCMDQIIYDTSSKLFKKK